MAQSRKAQAQTDCAGTHGCSRMPCESWAKSLVGNTAKSRNPDAAATTTRVDPKTTPRQKAHAPMSTAFTTRTVAHVAS